MEMVQELTQEEMDACQLVRRMPYRQGSDQDFICKTALFTGLYETQTGQEVKSKSVDALLFGCLVDGDYSRVDERLPQAREVVEGLFERTRFNPISEL